MRELTVEEIQEHLLEFEHMYPRVKELQNAIYTKNKVILSEEGNRRSESMGSCNAEVEEET